MQTTRDHCCQQPTQFAFADGASLLAAARSERLRAFNVTDTAKVASGLATCPEAMPKNESSLLIECASWKPCMYSACNVVKVLHYVKHSSEVPMHRLNAYEDRSPELPRHQPPVPASSAERSPTAASSGLEALLTNKEASQILKIHPKVLERMAKRGEVPPLKVGKFWRYRGTTLDAWINSRLQSERQPCRIPTSF